MGAIALEGASGEGVVREFWNQPDRFVFFMVSFSSCAQKLTPSSSSGIQYGVEDGLTNFGDSFCRLGTEYATQSAIKMNRIQIMLTEGF